MKAIILAAGRGSRMKDKTDILPKCLTQLWSKTLLEWQIEALRDGGVEEIAVVTGYRAEEIKTRQPQLHYFHNSDWSATNMVATLLKAEDWLKNDDCIISYSDIVYKSTAVDSLIKTDSDIAITYYTKFLELWKKRFDNPLDDIETFKLDQSSNLTEIGHKAASLNEIEGQYMGLLKFTPSGWSTIRDAMKKDLPKPIEKIDMTSLLSHLLSLQINIKAVPYDDLWLEVDNPEDLALYESWQ